jgi:hypothetical protein
MTKVTTTAEVQIELKFIYERGMKFCATDEQHHYVHSYDPNSRLGDSYDCVHCDDFQVG